MKPFLKIGIIVAAIVVVGLIIYFIWAGLTASPNTPGINVPGQNAGLPVSSSSQEQAGGESGNQTTGASTNGTSTLNASSLLKISENSAIDYWVDSLTKEVYYISPDGRVWSAKSGEDTKVSDQTLGAINSVEVWPNGQRVLVAFGDPGSPQWAIFDVIDAVWHPLPQGTVSATWGANANDVVAVVGNGNNYALVRMDISKNPPTSKIIANNFNFRDVNMRFVPPDRLILSERGANFYSSRVWQMNLKDLSFNLIFSPSRGLLFDSTLDKSIFFKYSSSDGSFYILDNNLRTVMPVIFSTVPSKCDRGANASSTSIYCFGPQDTPNNLVLPDDYLEESFFSTDNLYLLTPSTGDIKSLLLSGMGGVPAIDAKEPYLSGNTLYFINRYNNSVYSLKLGS